MVLVWLFLIVPLVGFTIVLVMAFILARARAPTPPRDGSLGPWCLCCRYSLAATPEPLPCPECGAHKRFLNPMPSPRAAAWVALAIIGSLLSHVPIAVARIVPLTGPHPLYSAIATEAFFVAAAMLILAHRLRGRALVVPLLVLTLPQSAIDVADVILLNSDRFRNLSSLAFILWFDLLKWLAVPIAFILYAAIGMIAAKRARKR
jgi:hypothetical protein